MYQLQFSKSALADLEYFRKTEQKIILAGIEANLTYQPVTPTKNRKPLRSNQLARWELRIDDYRVFYDIFEEETVIDIVAIGWKKHNQLFIRGNEVKL